MVASFKTPVGQKRIYPAMLLGMLLLEPCRAHFHDPRLAALIARRRLFINPRLGGSVTAVRSGRPTMERS